MKTPLSLLAGFFLVPVTALAQRGTSAELPPGPLIKSTAPEFSAWQVSCTYEGGPEKAESRRQEFQKALAKMAEQDPAMAKFLGGSPAGTTPRPRVTQLSTVKTGEIRQETMVFEGGKKEEIWEAPGTRLRKNAFDGKIHLETGVMRPDELGDFPEFSWIGKENFRGIKPVKGRPCLIFESRVQRGILEDPRNGFQVPDADLSEDAFVTATAAVDLETRLPVQLQWEDQTRTYEFRRPPAQKLVFPEEFARVLQQSLQRARSATAPLTPR
jgi:hypothetical protein